MRDVVDGRYSVERTLGRGGMGAVMLVVHEHLGTRHAMKLLLGDAWQDDTFKARFLREAKAAAGLRSRHVAKVSDFGFLPSGAPYMVMEYLEGQDLGAILSERGPLPPADAACFMIQACDALVEAHASGIVHRDVKPSNLFVTRDEDDHPIIKVLDFGIAKVPASAGGSHHVSTGGFFGTVPYVSPEQIRSTRDVDGRADVWSLGVTLYELLTGVLPFHGETPLETFAKILEEQPAPPSRRRPDLPAALDDVVMGCLQKRQAERTPDAAALARALLPFAPKKMREQVERISQRAGSVSAKTPQPESAGPPSSEEPNEPNGTLEETPRKMARPDAGAAWAETLAAPPSRRRIWPLIAAGVAAVAVAGAWLAYRATAQVAPVPVPSGPAQAAMASAVQLMPVRPPTTETSASSIVTPAGPPAATVAATSTVAATITVGTTAAPRRILHVVKPNSDLPNLPSDSPASGP